MIEWQASGNPATVVKVEEYSFMRATIVAGAGFRHGHCREPAGSFFRR
ncbi:MAG: hypothetical protein K6U04_13290 [Armatimonadetes bacterium]|nr:hypothetical protein [Armatimonadota bacterium]